MKKKSFVAIVLAIALSLVAFSLSACVGNINGNWWDSSHEHTFSSSWSNDETFHWHAATCGHTEEIRDREAHTFIDDECSKCHYKKSQQQGGGLSGDEKTVLRTVTFDTDGDESVNPMQFEVGKLMKDLPTPTRSGYKFLYWCDISGVEYDATTIMPDSDLMLYAHWQKKVTEYKDEYVTLSPATQGVKNPLIQSQYADEVDVFVYVEITSDDLGGIGKVNTPNNFTLRTMEGMAYKKADGYDWAWYQGDFSTPNGNQRFTLNYGSNVQLVTISSSGTVVRTYLVDIYVRRDFYMNLYSDLAQKEPYTKVRVIEGNLFDSETQEYKTGYDKFEYDKRVYYNTSTRKYEPFKYSTAILSDWNLYQTYKPYEAEVEVGEGALDEPVTIVPFEKNQILAKPTKTNSEFLGWQTSDGKYFCDVTGDTGDNYYTSSTSKLTAVYADSKLYYHKEINVEALTQKYVGKKTVPLVAYTDDKKTDICEVVYVPYGEEAIAPQKVPTKNNMIFTGWYYKDERGGEQRFDFSETVTEPVAIYPKFESLIYSDMGTGRTTTFSSIPLNCEKDQGSSRNTNGYKAYLPTDGEYTLTVTTTSRVEFTVQAYGTAKANSYTATSSSPRTITLQFDSTDTVSYPYGGYVTITVTSLTGSFATKLTGATAKSSRGLLAEEEALDYGDQVTIKPLYLGYEMVSVYNNGQEVSQADYTFNAYGDFEYTCNLKIDEALVPFEFGSNEMECKITGIKDNGTDMIAVPDYVTEIEESAFSDCGNLTSIMLPFVGDKPHAANEQYQYPFGYIFGTSSYSGGTATEQRYYGSSTSSTTYTTYYIPTSLKTVMITGGSCILYGAFYGCDNITKITIPNSVTLIDGYAFYYCESLTKITIPASVTTIGESAFSYCRDLRMVTFSGDSKLETIGNSAFSFCRDLQTVTFAGDSKLKSIGSGAFSGCSNLTSITIPANVTSIGSCAFSGCKLTEITIPASVTTIGESAFSYCRDLQTVTLAGDSKLESLGSEAFKDCYKLIEICNNSSLQIVAGQNTNGDIAYYAKNVYSSTNGSSKLITRDDYIFYEDDEKGEYYLVSYTGSQTEISLPEIGHNYGINTGAFYNCDNLTKITIPASVISIGDKAFYNCDKLIEICNNSSLQIVAGQSKNGYVAYYAKNVYSSSTGASKLTNYNDYIFHEDSEKNEYYLVSYTGSQTEISLPEIGYDYEIYNFAFSGCSNLTEIAIPASVTAIGNYAFYNCTNLRTVTFAADSKLKSIDGWAFYGCSRLTKITIPASVTSIGEVGDGYLNSYGSSVFYHCTNLQTVTFAGDSKLETIGSYAFVGCIRLTKITIPASVTSIGRGAFNDCANLQKVNFENSDGWKVSPQYRDMDDDIDISQTDLQDKMKAAQYLCKNSRDGGYSDYYWERS